MRELVIVIADLYLSQPVAAGPSAALPGIERLARYGVREHLPGGWREWFACRLGRTDLAGAAPAWVALAASQAAAPGADPATSAWIATPVQLTAGLSRVYLEARGILRLPRPQQEIFAADFARVFGGDGLHLEPLLSGDFLLLAPGVTAVATTEPARCAGGEVAGALPQGKEAAALRRLSAEIEMWLHGQAQNEARVLAGESPVTALWLWGGQGSRPSRAAPAPRTAALAFGCDAYVWGLMRLCGGDCRRLPQDFAPLIQADAPETLVVLEAAAEAQPGDSLHAALVRLDGRWVVPALAALKRGEFASVALIANDTCLKVDRTAALRFWRRPRPGLGSFVCN